MQITQEGVHAVLRHRKALLQHLARDLAPTVHLYLQMRDWVAGVGGPVLATMEDQLYLHDQGLGDTLHVLSKSVFASCFIACFHGVQSHVSCGGHLDGCAAVVDSVMSYLNAGSFVFRRAFSSFS